MFGGGFPFPSTWVKVRSLSMQCKWNILHYLCTCHSPKSTNSSIYTHFPIVHRSTFLIACLFQHLLECHVEVFHSSHSTSGTDVAL